MLCLTLVESHSADVAVRTDIKASQVGILQAHSDPFWEPKINLICPVLRNSKRE